MSRVEVILPVLDEAEALPGVLAAMPDGYAPIVVDNGSTDGSADIARDLGAGVVTEQQRGFGAACWAGLEAAEAEVVAFMDCDGSLDPAELPRVADPVLEHASDLVLGMRLAERGAWPIHSRLANRALSKLLSSRTGTLLRDLGPMRAVRRADLLSLGMLDRRFGWPLEMVIRARHAGWRIDEVGVGYAPRIGRSKVTGTVRGTTRAIKDMTRVLRELGPPPPITATVIVIAKEPAPGQVKTRLVPPFEPGEAAALAESALTDTLSAVAALPGVERILALEGDPGDWLPPGFRIVEQVEGGLDRRLAAAIEEADGPVFVVGMDTPQITPELIAGALETLAQPGTGAVLGPAPDGGYWSLGLREPRGDAVEGVPMSVPFTAEAQRRRLGDLGIEVRELPALRDVDTYEDAVAVANAAPHTRFAAELERIGVTGRASAAEAEARR